MRLDRNDLQNIGLQIINLPPSIDSIGGQNTEHRCCTCESCSNLCTNCTNCCSNCCTSCATCCEVYCCSKETCGLVSVILLSVLYMWVCEAFTWAVVIQYKWAFIPFFLVFLILEYILMYRAFAEHKSLDRS